MTWPWVDSASHRLRLRAVAALRRLDEAGPGHGGHQDRRQSVPPSSAIAMAGWHPRHSRAPATRGARTTGVQPWGAALPQGDELRPWPHTGAHRLYIPRSRSQVELPDFCSGGNPCDGL